jgi:hypothetical protein
VDGELQLRGLQLLVTNIDLELTSVMLLVSEFAFTVVIAISVFPVFSAILVFSAIAEPFDFFFQLPKLYMHALAMFLNLFPFLGG